MSYRYHSLSHETSSNKLRLSLHFFPPRVCATSLPNRGKRELTWSPRCRAKGPSDGPRNEGSLVPWRLRKILGSSCDDISEGKHSLPTAENFHALRAAAQKPLERASICNPLKKRMCHGVHWSKAPFLHPTGQPWIHILLTRAALQP